MDCYYYLRIRIDGCVIVLEGSGNLAGGRRTDGLAGAVSNSIFIDIYDVMQYIECSGKDP